ncbi:MAG: cysteine peptidase family C39 domain-containing protein [Gemmatimonadales bacterium]
MRRFARLILVVLVIGAGLGAAVGAAQHPVRSIPADSPTPLAVPYLPQTVLLCGGAALAMVERWWGRRGVYAEEFASLVQPALGGIRTTDLDSAARARGWETRAIRGTPEVTRQLLRAGVPVIALLEVAPDRYHYVVVLEWDADGVVFHDPAVAPSTQLSEAAFLSQWAGSEHWALVVQPRALTPPDPAAGAQPPPPAPVDSLPCRPWLDRALDAVAANQLDAAANLLDQAAHACPAEPLVQRELAGVRFKQGRHAETIRLATGYLVAVPHDALAWQLLATSRYLSGDLAGALVAWNRIDRPVVDLVVINGSRSIRYRQLATAVSVPHGTLLTPSHLALARRRLQDVPALRGATVAYRAVPGGVVEVHADVVERPVVAPAWRVAATNLTSALTQEAVALEGASLLGAGERWMAEWRWERARPRAALRLDVPARVGVPGVVSLEGAREGMRLATDPAALTVVEDTWRSVRLGFGAWLSAAVRPTMSLGLERWSGARTYLTLSSGAELRTRRDRLRFTVSGTHAAAVSDHAFWRRGGARVMWASSLGLSQAAWSARLGGDWTSANTPLGAWPLAGGNLSRAIPLRAEPSPTADVLAGRTAGRSILHAGVAGDLPVHRAGPLVFAVGAFLDGARVAASADPTIRDRNYLDGGVGIRIGLADGELGVLRADLARGLLADRRSALTVGMHLTWPVFPHASR